MKNLSEGKDLLERAVKRWEDNHTGPELKCFLAKIGKQQRIEEENNRAEHADRIYAVHILEANLQELTFKKEKELAQPRQQREQLFTTQEEWLVQHGQELSKDIKKEALVA